VKLNAAVDDAKSYFSNVVANLKSDPVQASVCECERLLKTSGIWSGYMGWAAMNPGLQVAGMIWELNTESPAMSLPAKVSEVKRRLLDVILLPVAVLLCRGVTPDDVLGSVRAAFPDVEADAAIGEVRKHFGSLNGDDVWGLVRRHFAEIDCDGGWALLWNHFPDLGCDALIRLTRQHFPDEIWPIFGVLLPAAEEDTTQRGSREG
jgi:hypothetical protein